MLDYAGEPVQVKSVCRIVEGKTQILQLRHKERFQSYHTNITVELDLLLLFHWKAPIFYHQAS